jgi:hypothetical protein
MRALPLLLVAGACSASTPDANVPVTTATTRATVAPQTTVDLTRQDEVNTIEVGATRTAVWNALLETHEALAIPLSAMDEPAGALTFTLRDKTRTIAGKNASAYVDCGNGPAGPRADSYRLTIKVNHNVVSTADNQTQVHTLIEAWARHPGQSGDAIQCNSRGTLEKHIAGIVRTRLQQR